MPIMEPESYPKKILSTIFILDTSGSMCGERIKALNSAMREIVQGLQARSDDFEYKIKLGVLQFSKGAKWLTQELVSIENYAWEDLTADGLTDFGAAIYEINKKFSRQEFFSDQQRYLRPTLICVSDGAPTDNWEDALNTIKKENKWFYLSNKWAFALGDDADIAVLQKFCDSEERVIPIDNLDGFKEFVLTPDVIMPYMTGIQPKRSHPINITDYSLGLSEKTIYPPEYAIKLTGAEMIHLHNKENVLLKHCQLHPCDPDVANLEICSLQAVDDGVAMRYLDNRMPIDTASCTPPHSISELSDVVISRTIRANTKFSFKLADYEDFYLVDPNGGWGNIQELQFHINNDELALLPLEQDVLFQRRPIYSKEMKLISGDSLVSKKFGTLFTVIQTFPDYDDESFDSDEDDWC